VPVAPDLLKAPESFTLRGRKTGNERCALTPIVDELRCKSDSETSSKTDEKTCPEHHGKRPRPVKRWGAGTARFQGARGLVPEASSKIHCERDGSYSVVGETLLGGCSPGDESQSLM
jgi:hypothetical protein